MTRTATFFILAMIGTAVGGDANIASSAHDDTIAARADAAVEAVVSPEGPGLAAAIVRNGEVVWRAYIGQADLDHGIEIAPESAFYLGSLTKPLLAATVMSLVHEGELTLDESIRRHLPELPGWANQVSIRQLLQMTSGIRDYLKLRDLAGEPKDGYFDNASAMMILARQQGLVFEPGTRYQYSNSNYVLLAEIVARVSGGSVSSTVDAKVLTPLGMHGGLLEDDYTTLVPGRVVSYHRRGDGGWHRYLKNFSSIGDGGGWATLDDLVAFDRAIATKDGLLPEILSTMLQPAVLVDGTHGPYGAGLLVREWRGLAVVEHGGFMLGFQHHYLHFPEQGVSVVLLTNNHEIDSFGLRDQLAEIALAGAAPAEDSGDEPSVDNSPASTKPEKHEFIPMSADASGCYWNEEVPLGIEIIGRDVGWAMRPASFREVPMTQIGPASFAAMGGHLAIEIDVPQRPSDTVEAIRLVSEEFGTLMFSAAGTDRCEPVG